MDANQRKARLTDLLDRIRSGQDVAQRDMRNVLTLEQYADLQSEWETQKGLRSQARTKPAAVVEYEKRLKRATLEHNRAEGYSGRPAQQAKDGKKLKDAIRRSYARAESHCESLIEYLQECVAADPSLCMWFDRPLNFGPDGLWASTPEEMPRVVTSRSTAREGGGFLAGVQRKRQVKERALESALAKTLDEEELVKRIAAQIARDQTEQDRIQQLKMHDLRTRAKARRSV